MEILDAYMNIDPSLHNILEDRTYKALTFSVHLYFFSQFPEKILFIKYYIKINANAHE